MVTAAASRCPGTMMTSEGQVLHDRYRVLSHLGAGGMGSVWLGEDQLLERRVALKELVPRARIFSRSESRARALVEARAMARVRHRAIVRIHDIFFVDDVPWIVMEYISGRSLAEMVRDERLDERTISAVGLTIAQGLRAVHMARIVHRDVKPANILADSDGSVFLVDFGIAKIARDMPLTGQSKILGTTEFMAPERLLGHPAQAASDFWSLGATLYSALERRSPFAGRDSERSLEATITAILNEKPPTPQRAGPLADLMLRLLSKNPAERPEAKEVIGILDSILRPPPHPEPRPRQAGTETAASSPTASGKIWSAASSVAQVMQADNGRVDDRELSRRVMADAVKAANRWSTDSGVDMLLSKSDVEAAQILAACSLDVAAELLQSITTKQARRAGTILQILSVSRSGKIIDYLLPGSAASIVAAMSPDDAVRILSQSDARTAADVVMTLPGRMSAELIKAMPRPRAVIVLSHARPATVAAVLGAVPAQLRSSLLTGLSADFRVLVIRHM
jgi:serine/threonine protein kinase